MEVVLPLTPVPWGRPRFRIVTPLRGKPFVQSYTAPEVARFKQEIKKSLLARRCPKIDGPVAVKILFRLARPKSVTEKKRPLPCVKPDLDNLCKAVLDSCNGILWEDDARICDLVLRKRYAAAGDWPGILLRVEALADTSGELGLE